MPLIVLCGIPSSGKTTHAKQLYAYFKDKYTTVHLINDESLLLSKQDAYQDTNVEKKSRATFFAAIERALTPNSLVIADGMNYIKGYRYQIYCVVRGQQTTHAVVHICTPLEQARAWNQQRSLLGYPEDTFEALASRFEEPIAFNRWDKPLINVMPGDDTPCERIHDALISGKILAANTANLPQSIAPVDYLYELNRLTQDIVQAVVKAQQEGLGGGGEVGVPHSQLKVSMRRSVTLSEMMRHRRQYISANKMHSIQDTQRIADMFVGYLNLQLN
jgi:protein KTI12